MRLGERNRERGRVRDLPGHYHRQTLTTKILASLDWRCIVTDFKIFRCSKRLPCSICWRRTIQLAGSVEFYQRHIFLRYKNPQVWPSKIEASKFDQVPRLLFAAFKARKADMNKETFVLSVDMGSL
ncbi:hypothetical protein CMV_030480 [Castanea mollissima]|uniref:Uncharacterized protein n=1 Tax=Castanea mollissima TaxID=60419 RepID=A0A8J4VCB5_9ROSI|nr:hypothetical protein CMV_030480 [Castanea mollissima]